MGEIEDETPALRVVGVGVVVGYLVIGELAVVDLDFGHHHGPQIY